MVMTIAQVGEEVLKTPAIKVTSFDLELNQFLDNLLETMHAANGIGIAAPKVFDPRSIMIMGARPNPR